MVKYSVEAIKALLNPIEKIQGRPQFSSLYKLAQKMDNKLCKVYHPIYPNNGYSGYMMDVHDFRLFNTVLRQDPVDVGTFFKFPVMAIPDMDQKSEERQWQA